VAKADEIKEVGDLGGGCVQLPAVEHARFFLVGKRKTRRLCPIRSKEAKSDLKIIAQKQMRKRSTVPLAPFL
jgi:hypothetical protein